MGLRKIKKDLRFAAGLVLRRPFNALLQVTNRCNMRCSFCDFWPHGVHPREELTTEDFSDLARQMAQMGCFLVSIEGGEPLVRKDIVEIVEIFARHHLPVLYTNGWYITEEKARELFAAGLHQVGVSIDYPTPKDHDGKRGLPGAFQRATQALKHFRKAAPRGRNQVHIMTVLMEENQGEMDKLLHLSDDLEVNHCLTLLSTQGYRRGTEVDKWPTRSLSDHLLELWKKHSHFMIFRDYLKYIDPFLNQEEMPTCRAGSQSFNIDHVGNLAPCIEKIDEPVGNIRETKVKVLLERLKDREEEISQCQDCWTLCRGFSQLLGGGGTLKSWLDMTGRMKV